MSTSQPKSLPEDLLFDILLRLPVKPLLRFTSVCKSWCSMITESRFVSEHLKRSSRNGSSACFVVANNNNVHPRMSNGRPNSIALLSSTLEVQRTVEAPPLMGSTPFEIVGTCDGIVCLSSWFGLAILWNPVIGDCRIVHSPSESCPRFLIGSCYGFGHSYKIDDYRLLRMVVSREDGRHDRMLAEVFTLKEDSWREVQPPGYYPDHNIGGTLVNGTLNWIASGVRDKETQAVLCFDLDNDEFKPIHIRPELEKGNRVRRKLAALESSLLFITYYWHIISRPLEIWMTNPQATQPIWTRLVRIDHPHIGVPRPLGLGIHGEIYIDYQFGHRVVVYESSSGTVLGEQDGVDEKIPSHQELFPYVESLVPVTFMF